MRNARAPSTIVKGKERRCSATQTMRSRQSQRLSSDDWGAKELDNDYAHRYWVLNGGESQE